jgi:hypothetical protein
MGGQSAPRNPYTANGQPFDQRFFLTMNLAVGGRYAGDVALPWAQVGLMLEKYLGLMKIMTT